MLTGASANATTPSRLWWGVERIVVACDVDAGAESMKAALCQATTDFIRSRVSQPVVARADAKGGDPAADLIVMISARPSGPSSLELTVRPKRIEIMNQAPASLVTTVVGSANTPAALAALVEKSLAKVVPVN